MLVKLSPGLTRLAAGPSLVALGAKDGKIHVYESSQGILEFKMTENKFVRFIR